MTILVALAQTLFLQRDAETLARELCRALVRAGHTAEIVRIPFKWSPPAMALDHILACRLLDLSPDQHHRADVLIALEFPAYLLPHPNKVIWLTHHRRYYRSPDECLGDDDSAALIEACREADRKVLPTAKRVFSISATASYQLRRATELDAVPLYPPPRRPDKLYWDRAEDYVWVPRGSRLDRLELVLRALALCSEPVRARFCLDRDEAAAVSAAAERLGVGDRIECLESPADPVVLEQYARCRAVLCPTLEATVPWTAFDAMLAAKPVVTCLDSGAPAEVTDHAETGLVVGAEDAELASAIDEIWAHPGRARAMGISGRSKMESQALHWPGVIETLLS